MHVVGGSLFGGAAFRHIQSQALLFSMSILQTGSADMSSIG